MVHWKHKPLEETTWTPGLLDVFMDTCFKYSATPGNLPLLIKGKSTEIQLTPSGEVTRSSTYAGNFPHRDLKSIYYVLTVLEHKTRADQDSLGYLEVLNGMTADEDKTPMLRGFVNGNLDFFKQVDDLIRDAKSFETDEVPITLEVFADFQDFIHASAHDIYSSLKNERVYRTKIEIKEIGVYRSFEF